MSQGMWMASRTYKDQIHKRSPGAPRKENIPADTLILAQ